MEAPDKIYIEQKAIMYDLVNTEPCKKDDFEYIRKDALLKWAREKMNINLIEADNTDDRFTYGVAAGFGAIVDKLKSM